MPGLMVLVSMSLLSAVLGTVHAFSVFLVPIETALQVNRATVSFTYSLALVCLTLAVLLGHRLYGALHPAVFVVAVSGVAAVGAVISAQATSIGMIWLGYGVVFGAANGLGYGFGLQFAAQMNPGREGLSMGIVTAAYALGASIAPGLFDAALSAGGYENALWLFGVVLAVVGLLCAVLLWRTPMRYQRAKPGAQARLPGQSLMVYWLAYGSAVAAGLMMIGHAATLAQARGVPGPGWATPGVIALCNLGGSLIAGRLADLWSHRTLLTALPALSAMALICGLVATGGWALLALGAVGFAYGGIIAVYPVMIARRFGPVDSARAYGRVFTAWGVAGLVAPWLAGALFDLSGTYTIALSVGAGLALFSAVFFHRNAEADFRP